jgi:hypothetical protein
VLLLSGSDTLTTAAVGGGALTVTVAVDFAVVPVVLVAVDETVNDPAVW